MSNKFRITATALDDNGVRVSATISEVLGDDLFTRYSSRRAALKSAREIKDQADTARFPGLQLEVVGA